jgi:hypothetical protein
VEAPAYGRGLYRFEEIEGILATAFTGFSAAVAETARLAPGSKTVIHTGWWGSGAYGGNPELMALLQLVAAGWARVDRVVFYLGDGDRRSILDRAAEVSGDLPPDPSDLVAAIESRQYQWGVSDGN